MPPEETSPSAQRTAWLAELRRQIQAGTYETEAKLESAVDAMLERGVLSDRRPSHDD